VPTYNAAVRLELRNPNLNNYLTVDFLNSWTGAPLTLPRGTFTPSLLFSTPICSGVRSLYRIDRQTDGQHPYCGLLGRPHNNTATAGLCVLNVVQCSVAGPGNAYICAYWRVSSFSVILSLRIPAKHARHRPPNSQNFFQEAPRSHAQLCKPPSPRSNSDWHLSHRS